MQAYVLDEVPQAQPAAPVSSPDDVMSPKDRRRAWTVEIVQATAAALGVLGFNLESSHTVSQWVMAIAFQLALLGGAEVLKIPFAIKCRTAETPARRTGAGLGLAAGTAISAIGPARRARAAITPRRASATGAGSTATATRSLQTILNIGPFPCNPEHDRLPTWQPEGIAGGLNRCIPRGMACEGSSC